MFLNLQSCPFNQFSSANFNVCHSLPLSRCLITLYLPQLPCSTAHRLYWLVPCVYSQVVITVHLFLVFFFLLFTLHCSEWAISKHFTVNLNLLLKHVTNTILWRVCLNIQVIGQKWVEGQSSSHIGFHKLFSLKMGLGDRNHAQMLRYVVMTILKPLLYSKVSTVQHENNHLSWMTSLAVTPPITAIQILGNHKQ